MPGGSVTRTCSVSFPARPVDRRLTLREGRKQADCPPPPDQDPGAPRPRGFPLYRDGGLPRPLFRNERRVGRTGLFDQRDGSGERGQAPLPGGTGGAGESGRLMRRPVRSAPAPLPSVGGTPRRDSLGAGGCLRSLARSGRGRSSRSRIAAACRWDAKSGHEGDPRSGHFSGSGSRLEGAAGSAARRRWWRPARPRRPSGRGGWPRRGRGRLEGRRPGRWARRAWGRRERSARSAPRPRRHRKSAWPNIDQTGFRPLDRTEGTRSGRCPRAESGVRRS